MWMWIALFTLPFMYRTCRHALDALVEETLLFVAEVVRGGEHPHRSTAPSAGHLALSAMEALLMLCCLSLCKDISLFCVPVVMLWQKNCHPRL